MISKEDIRNLYREAFFTLEEDQLDEIYDELVNLVEFNSVIDTLEDDGNYMEINTENIMEFRDDVEEEGMDREEALSAARNRQYGYFKLKRVVK